MEPTEPNLKQPINSEEAIEKAVNAKLDSWRLLACRLGPNYRNGAKTRRRARRVVLREMAAAGTQ